MTLDGLLVALRYSDCPGLVLTGPDLQPLANEAMMRLADPAGLGMWGRPLPECLLGELRPLAAMVVTHGSAMTSGVTLPGQSVPMLVRMQPVAEGAGVLCLFGRSDAAADAGHDDLALVLIDEQQLVRHAGPALLRWLGRTGPDLLGLPLREILSRCGEIGPGVSLTEALLTDAEGQPLPVRLRVLDLHQARGDPALTAILFERVGSSARSCTASLGWALLGAPGADAVIGVGADLRIRYWDGGAAALFGRDASQVLGTPIRQLLDEIRDIPGQVIDSRELLLRHADGRRIRVGCQLLPVEGGTGGMLLLLGAHLHEAARRDRQDMHDLVLGEMKHRIKNILAMVHIVARQSFGSAGSPQLSAFLARLGAMSRGHDLLTRLEGDWADMREVLRDVLSPYPIERFDIVGPPLELCSRAVATMALGLHELATNAAKYGALSCPDGKVSIHWNITDEPVPQLTLDWRESGGPVVLPPKSRGFGSVLIRRVMGGQLGGEAVMNFHPDGVRCLLKAPLDPTWGRCGLRGE